MTNPITAGLRYFLPVFAFAFLAGIVRTLVVAPRLGEVVAVSLEVPLVLGVSWAVCRRIVGPIDPRPMPRAVMGITAFALLMIVELVMATLVFGRSPSTWLAGFRTLAGQIGFVGQIGFGLMPLLVRR